MTSRKAGANDISSKSVFVKTEEISTTFLAHMGTGEWMPNIHWQNRSISANGNACSKLVQALLRHYQKAPPFTKPWIIFHKGTMHRYTN